MTQAQQRLRAFIARRKQTGNLVMNEALTPDLEALLTDNEQLRAERTTRMQQNDRMAERIAQLEAAHSIKETM